MLSTILKYELAKTRAKAVARFPGKMCHVEKR